MAWKGLSQPTRKLGSPEHQPRGVSSLSGAGPNHWFQGKRQHPGGLFLLGADREELQIRARCEAALLWKPENRRQRAASLVVFRTRTALSCGGRPWREEQEGAGAGSPSRRAGTAPLERNAPSRAHALPFKAGLCGHCGDAPTGPGAEPVSQGSAATAPSLGQDHGAAGGALASRDPGSSDRWHLVPPLCRWTGRTA